MYTKCRDCKYRCTCCSSRGLGINCSGCENYYDQFKPAENIFYCPLDGSKIAEKGYTVTYIIWDDGHGWVAGRFKTEDEKNQFLDKIKRPDSGWTPEELNSVSVINDYNYMMSK